MPRKETYAGPLSAQAQQDLVSEGIENFELPKSVVMKIAKSALPDHIKLQKETVLSLVKGSTVFINYLAAIAHDVAQSKQHKSISASDVLKALETIEFGDMVNKLQAELNIYREVSKNDKGKKGSSSAAAARKAAANTSASAPVKAKGKEKDKLASGSTLPPPFTSAPLGNAPTNPRVAQLSETAMDVDEEVTSVSAVGRAEDDELDEDDIEAVEDAIIENDEDESEEELKDKDALEEDELKQDAKGVEERGATRYDDDD